MPQHMQDICIEMQGDVQVMNPKRCKYCRAQFNPFRPLQIVCSHGCALSLITQKREKEERKKAQEQRKTYREAKERIKSRGEWLKEAQTAFNSWIRARDDGQPCISCGSFTGKKNAGHYRSVGSSPELRFEPLNVWLQCEKCNSYLSGNLISYRINLIARIGQCKVEWLEGKHDPKKYTIEELKQIKAKYLKLAREIKSPG